jgi:hypothetical protein
MTATRTFVALIAVLMGLSPTMVRGADRILLGKSLTIRGAGSTRSIVILGREQATDVPAITDPRLGGATLSLVAIGGTTTTEFHTLTSTGWAPIANGYRYASTGSTLHVRIVARRTAAGLGLLKVIMRGDGSVLPPNPGDEGGMLLDVVSGDRYCVRFGGAAGGTEKADDVTRWKVVNASTEDGCLTPPPICGNNVREGTEECDGIDQSSCFPLICLPDCSCPTCGEVICSPELGVPCCPGAVCVDTPGLFGACFTGQCDDPADCAPFGTCEDGLCCTPPGAPCMLLPGGGGMLPCCSGGTCVAVPELGGDHCCLPAGASCDGSPVPCCSGSCNAGTSTCD